MHNQNRSDREIGLENIMETMYEGKSHKCATHVEHSKWGKGECIPEQHAAPLYGSVEWYTVMFEHGTEKAYSCDLTILEESHHRHMKKKKKVDEKHEKECDHCKGTGKHGDKKCEKCKGTGVILISADKDSGKPYADSGMMIKFTKDSVEEEEQPYDGMDDQHQRAEDEHENLLTVRAAFGGKDFIGWAGDKMREIGKDVFEAKWEAFIQDLEGNADDTGRKGLGSDRPEDKWHRGRGGYIPGQHD